MFANIKTFFPPQKWRLSVSIVSGILVGFLLLTIHLSRAGSYMSDAPEVCVNCHVMAPHYATWMHSSHREVAKCSDCHVPQDNIVRSYFFKAKDGLRHSSMFIFRQEAHAIQMKEDGIYAVQSNCIRCHIDQIQSVSLADVNGENYKDGAGKLCWDCHRHVPHGTVRSETSVPHTYLPDLHKGDKIIRSINYERKK